MTDVVNLIGEVKSSVENIKQSNAALDTMVKELNAAAAEGKTLSKDALAAATKLAIDIEAQGNRLADIEQKVAEGVKRGNDAPKSLGTAIIQAQGFKDFASGLTSRGRFEVQANTISGQDGTSPIDSDSTLVPSQRRAGIIELARRRLTVRGALPSAPTTSNAIEFVKESTWTNNAAETAEAAQKPESVLAFTPETVSVRTIAHFIKATKQILEDAPALAGYIDAKMSYGVDYRIDSQLLNGTGTGQQLSGLLKSGNFTAFTPTSGDSALDSINRAKYLLEASDYYATAIMLNPATFGVIERLKADTSGTYLVGSPNGTTLTPFLWGLPVVLSNAFPANKLHVSNIQMLATVYNRSGTVVEMFEQDGDNVQKNLITIRAEARLALAVETPAAALYGNITL
jgi:HK97 family phage major capsid protein